MSMKFAVLCNHSLYAKALSCLLSSEMGTGTLYPTSDPLECLALIRDGKAAAVLLEQSALSPEAVAYFIGALQLKPFPIVMLTEASGPLPDDRLGAIECSLDAAPTDVVAVLRSIHSLQSSSRPKLRETRTPVRSNLQMLLSGRELEVAELVSKGMSNRQIGAQLELRDQSVRNYISKVLGKTSSANRTELALKLAEDQQSRISVLP